MIVYRITNKEFKDNITGSGAALYGSRWNSTGVKLLYTSAYISLSILESLVHLKKTYIPATQFLLHIELPESDLFSTVLLKNLKQNWEQHFEYTQWIGDHFISENKSLILKVPSAVVPQENNFLINPLHTGFKKIKIISSELLELDKRLLQIQ